METAENNIKYMMELGFDRQNLLEFLSFYHDTFRTSESTFQSRMNRIKSKFSSKDDFMDFLINQLHTDTYETQIFTYAGTLSEADFDEAVNALDHPETLDWRFIRLINEYTPMRVSVKDNIMAADINLPTLAYYDAAADNILQSVHKFLSLGLSEDVIYEILYSHLITFTFGPSWWDKNMKRIFGFENIRDDSCVRLINEWYEAEDRADRLQSERFCC